MSENETPKSIRHARWTAGTVIGMGLLASVAGNVQSILLEDKAPSVGAILSVVWWPALLFAMIHLALTIPWGTGAWRWGRWIGPGVIGGLAFYISFFHLAHVLSYYGYDVVSRYAGPLTVDVAMFVATIAWSRTGVAKELANLAELAIGGQEELATDVATDDLASDWDEAKIQEELASYVAEAKAAPEPVAAEEPAAAPEPERAEEPAQAASKTTGTVTLTKVPALAAKHIQAALEATPDAPGTELAAALVAADLAPSDRTARRWVAAVKNNTARVS